MPRTTNFVRAFALSLPLAGLCLSGASAQKQPGRDDSLKRYTSCRFNDGLKIVETDRLPKGVTHRTVNTLDGEKKVSLADGYRVMVAYPWTHFFANIKAEKSDPASYAADKQAVVETLKWAQANIKNPETAEPVAVSYNGFEGYSINRTNVEGGTIGITVLFSDAEQHIITVYFLNQKRRKFQTIEEWRALRENFLNNYTRCVRPGR